MQKNRDINVKKNSELNLKADRLRAEQGGREIQVPQGKQTGRSKQSYWREGNRRKHWQTSANTVNFQQTKYIQRFSQRQRQLCCHICTDVRQTASMKLQSSQTRGAAK